MIQFPDVSPSPEPGLCLRAGIDLPQCLNTWPHTGAQYDLRTLDVFEHLGHYARRLWKARAARAIFPFARCNFFRRGWWSIHELGSIYPIWDGWQLSLFLFRKNPWPRLSSVQNPCCLMILWDSTVGDFSSPGGPGSGCPFGTKSFGSMPAHFWSNSVPSPFLCTFLTILHLHAILYRRILQPARLHADIRRPMWQRESML